MLYSVSYLRGGLLRGQAGRDRTGRPPSGVTSPGTADEASAESVAVRLIRTDSTALSNSRDLTLQVATNGKHGTSRSDPGSIVRPPGTNAAVG